MISIIQKIKLNVVYSILILIAIWYIISFIVNNDVLMPYFHDVIKALILLLVDFNTYSIIFNTLFNIFVGIIISFLVAFTLFILSIYFEKIKELISPIITVIKTVPAAAITIILIILVGNFFAPILITFLVVFPIMYEGFIFSLTRVSKDQKEAVEVFSGINSYSIKKVYIPLMVPYLKNTLIQSIGLGIKVMVMAELLTQSSGSIGKQIYISKINLETDYLFAWVLVLILLALFIDSLINRRKTEI